MEMFFSRHARRRMQLYKIDEQDVKATIERALLNKAIVSGKYEEINYEFTEKYGYPLKAVFLKENECIIVITAYPLRKERGR